MIGRELKRILQKPTALVCVIIYIAVLFLGIESDLRAGYETGMLNLFWFTENFGATIFIQTLIFPIVAAGNYFDERKGHYDWLMQMRSGQLRYCLAKIVSAVLGGIILLYPESFSLIIPLSLGIWIITDSIFKIRIATSLKDNKDIPWILLLILSMLSLICGVIFIVHPIASSKIITSTFGIIVICYAICDIVDMVMFKKYINDIVKTLKKHLTFIEK